jgi:hypothetical protein
MHALRISRNRGGRIPDTQLARPLMETVYLVCALAGGTLLVCQFLLSLLGLGGHHDVSTDHDFDTDHSLDGHHETGHEHDHGHWSFLQLLTFRAVAAAVAFFGLAGLTAGPRLADETLTLVVAVGAGAAALLAVAWMMKTLYRLRADGTVRIDRAVGHTGTVYLTIPPGKAGVGKVTLTLQNRTVECQAVTQREESLPTGSKVVVVAVVGPDTVEVITAPEPERSAHV